MAYVESYAISDLNGSTKIDGLCLKRLNCALSFNESEPFYQDAYKQCSTEATDAAGLHHLWTGVFSD